MSARGKFITVEGMEGVGKTTNIQVIERTLTEHGVDFISTREPGGTPVAEDIRSLLLDHGTEPMDSMAELLLVFAARAQHVSQLIKPALEAGKWVVCDRFTDSTYAYQGGGRGISSTSIAALEETSIASFAPDLTVVLDLDPEVGLARAAARSEKDRFEVEGIEFFKRVRENYLSRAGMLPRMKIVDASQAPEHVAADIVQVLTAAIND